MGQPLDPSVTSRQLVDGGMIDSPAACQLLRQCISRRLTLPARQQFEAMERDIRIQWNETRFQQWFATASRTLGHEKIRLTIEEAAGLEQCGVGWLLSDALDELGRVVMLAMAASQLSDHTYHSLLHRCYENGDSPERCAVLRALPLLPDARRFLHVALDAGRSHIQPIFEALACENPYPSVYFPELNFNHMILKALFTGTALRRVLGLTTRLSPELRRMANDYATERHAAGRSVPADITLLLGQAEAVG